MKKLLVESAAYPRGFGLAIADLLPERGQVLGEHEPISLSYDSSGDDWGALDDILKGPRNCWWRKL